MKKPTLKEELIKIQDEVHSLLFNFYYFQERIGYAREQRSRLTDEQKFGEVAFLEAMERELMMCLCRLDEDDKTKTSFRSVAKALCEGSLPSSRQKEISSKLKGYRKAINIVKTKCRNNYIAHLANQWEGYMDKRPELGPLVNLAVELGDILSGKKKQYLLKFSDTDEPLDLRKALNMMPN